MLIQGLWWQGTEDPVQGCNTRRGTWTQKAGMLAAALGNPRRNGCGCPRTQGRAHLQGFRLARLHRAKQRESFERINLRKVKRQLLVPMPSAELKPSSALTESDQPSLFLHSSRL